MHYFNRLCGDVDMETEVRPSRTRTRYQCPCCRCFTLGSPSSYDICPVCFWEDDGQDDPHADVVWGGPNGSLSLAQARRNYAEIGATQERLRQYVRLPIVEEFPVDWPKGHGYDCPCSECVEWRRWYELYKAGRGARNA